VTPDLQLRAQASATGNAATFRARFTNVPSTVTKRFAFALLAKGRLLQARATKKPALGGLL
jgi:hypothetical protein